MFMGRFIFSISISVRCNILLLLRYIFIISYVNVTRAHARVVFRPRWFSCIGATYVRKPFFGGNNKDRFVNARVHIYGAVFINTDVLSEIYFPNCFYLYLCCTMYTRRTREFLKVGLRERERERERERALKLRNACTCI
jgi:hypothetical protein